MYHGLRKDFQNLLLTRLDLMKNISQQSSPATAKKANNKSNIAGGKSPPPSLPPSSLSP